MAIFVQVLFWLLALLVAYTYVGYPLCLWLRAKLVPGDPVRRESVEPTVSVLVIAHNEEKIIERKIENILALDYPRDKLEVVVASDASTDRTVALAQQYLDRGITVTVFHRHSGKPAVLNAVVPKLAGDIVVLMDARQTTDAGALRELLKNFADPTVGAVGGELVLTGKNEGGGGAGVYWRYEKWLRHVESQLDSTVGVSGAFYAIRQELFEPIPTQTLLDDVLIPMQVVKQGFRVLLERQAHAYDALVMAPSTEYRRKVRTIAGNFQLFHEHAWLLNPRRNRLWWQTVSHKLCRLLCPLALVMLVVLNVLLVEQEFYQWLLIGQGLFYSAAVLTHLLPRLAKSSKLFSIPYAFCLLNWCSLVGGYRYLRGAQKVTWAKSPSAESTTSSH